MRERRKPIFTPEDEGQTDPRLHRTLMCCEEKSISCSGWTAIADGQVGEKDRTLAARLDIGFSESPQS